MNKFLKKMLYILTIAILISSLAGCRFIPVLGQNKTKIDLYFTNKDNKIVTEQRDIYYQSEKDLPNKAMQGLIKGPKIAENKAIMPKNIKIIDINNKNNILFINLSKEYLLMPSVDEILARYSIVKTMCSLPNILGVNLAVDGKPIIGPDNNPIGILTKDDVILGGATADKLYKTIKVYFSEENAEYLVAEERQVISSENEPIERQIINELIKGPKNKMLHKTIPVEAKLISVETKNNICFVNFSKELISKHWGGSAGEAMTINSIVNSLTELPNIKKVQFLIEGSKVDTFIHLVFNEPFTRDESIIKK